MEPEQMTRALSLLVALTFVAPVSAALRNPLDALRLEDLAATRARPLFAPTRRPPPPPSARIGAPRPDPSPVLAKPASPPFELIGAVVGERESYAVLRRRGTEKAARFRLGDDADGWRVGAIGRRSVTLEREGRTQSLALAPPSAGSGVAPATEVAEKAAGEAAATPLAANFRRFARKARD
jgi:general secretion pathway protein N